jgi:hypothetical protein
MLIEKPIHRLSHFIEYIGITPYAFEASVKISNGYFAKQLKKGGAIGSDILQKINDEYKMLDIKWLLTGEGTMLTTDSASQHNQVELKSIKEAIVVIEKNLTKLKKDLKQTD